MKAQPRSPSLWLLRLRALCRPCAVASTRVHGDRAGTEVETDVETEAPGACGWFDSSYELVHGLHVQELTSPESQAAVLPLATWLQLQLEACGSVQAA